MPPKKSPQASCSSAHKAQNATTIKAPANPLGLFVGPGRGARIRGQKRVKMPFRKENVTPDCNLRQIWGTTSHVELSQNGDSPQSHLGIAGSRHCAPVDTPCPAGGREPANSTRRAGDAYRHSLPRNLGHRRSSDHSEPGRSRLLRAAQPCGSMPSLHLSCRRCAGSAGFRNAIVRLRAVCCAFQFPRPNSGQPCSGPHPEPPSAGCLIFRLPLLHIQSL